MRVRITPIPVDGVDRDPVDLTVASSDPSAALDAAMAHAAAEGFEVQHVEPLS